MPQDPTKRESLLFINAGSSNQLGTNKRGTLAGEPAADFIGNHYLRPDWGTVDRFRGVQGYYVASSPDNQPRNRASNSKKPLFSTRYYGDPGHFYYATEHTPGAADGQKFQNPGYILEPDTPTWNGGNVANTQNMLQKWIQDPGVNEGDPYYSYFLEQGVSMGGPQAQIPAVFNRTGPAGSFLDHTFAYLKPSEDPEIREDGGTEITVQAVYNFFLDTMPAYEQVTSDLPEAILPNFYICETELRNTGLTTYSPDYKNIITLYAGVGGNLDRMEDWFVENSTEAGYTETTSKSYYQAYASSLQAVKSDEANYNALKAQYNNRSKNIAVLHSDVGALNRTDRVVSSEYFASDQVTSALSFLPFYNIVTVGADQYRATQLGVEGEVLAAPNSFFSGLFDVPNFDAESFIDLLQMYIITMIEKGINPSAQFHAFSRQDNPTQTVVTASLYFDLSKRSAGAGSLPGVPAQYDGFENYADFLEQRITDNISWDDDFSQDVPDPNNPGNQYWERDNVVLIRDYSNTPGWVDIGAPQPNLPNLAPQPQAYNPPDPTAVADFYNKLGTGPYKIALPMRDFDDLLGNQGAFSETILYKIDKRVVDSAGNVSSNIAQTIYLSPKFAQEGNLQYIDSQVRYGVRYQYDIQQVRVVFGNQYQYDDLQIYTAGYAGYGRAVGNALGFYRATAEDIKVDAYVAAHISPYIDPPSQDTDFKTSQKGYFGVAPSNASEVSLEAWNYMAQGSNFGDNTKLSKVNLIFKRGFGFDGNPTGGALSAEYTVPTGMGMPSSEGAVFGGLGTDDTQVTSMTAPPAGSTTGVGVGSGKGLNPNAGAYQPQAGLQNIAQQVGAGKGQQGLSNVPSLPPGQSGQVLGSLLGMQGQMGPGGIGASGPFQGPQPGNVQSMGANLYAQGANNLVDTSTPVMQMTMDTGGSLGLTPPAGGYWQP